MNMTIEDAKEYKRNAVKVLRDNTQYATAKATEKAFNVLIGVIEFTEKHGGEIKREKSGTKKE